MFKIIQIDSTNIHTHTYMDGLSWSGSRSCGTDAGSRMVVGEGTWSISGTSMGGSSMSASSSSLNRTGVQMSEASVGSDGPGKENCWNSLQYLE